jgi:Kef-type K+ transport system membrane component KefB
VTMQWKWSYLLEVTLVSMILVVIDTNLTNHAIARMFLGLFQDALNWILYMFLSIVFALMIILGPAISQIVIPVAGTFLGLYFIIKYLLPTMGRAMTYVAPKKEEKKKEGGHH